jgi:hypothetical protein
LELVVCCSTFILVDFEVQFNFLSFGTLEHAFTERLGAQNVRARSYALRRAAVPAPTCAPGPPSTIRTPSRWGPHVGHHAPQVTLVATRRFLSSPAGMPCRPSAVCQPHVVRPRVERPRPGSWPVQLAPQAGNYPHKLPHDLFPSSIAEASEQSTVWPSRPLRCPHGSLHRRAPSSRPHHRASSAPEPPHGSTSPSRPPARLHYEHARRSWSSCGLRSTEPPRTTSGSSYKLSMHQNRTLGEQGPLPRPFSAKSDLLLAGIRPSSPLAAPGPDCNLTSSSKDLFAKMRLQI